ncbi:MAG: symmetrical bis(5'-nucleosyl)-tetraphosphatase [Gammaproteobacteria bacterium]|nr:symmetrical bis(5'-nucleosyl)-tetraphosphatase [Gammaproteobacteria bacterium]
MATYAIGDVQGCLDPLQRLLDALTFDPATDHLWFVGDLVNRGPRSLETLRFVRELGDAAITTLGNHDLHLLAAREGIRDERRNDTLRPIFTADDGDELLTWLRTQPLIHSDAQLQFVLVHAGIYPFWELHEARALAREVESLLAGDQYRELLRNMYGDRPSRWDPEMCGFERLRFIVNVFTRMRYCSPSGELDFDHNGPPGTQPPGLLPWFAVPNRKTASQRIVFGHWASLPHFNAANLFPLDSGCVWGRNLSALRLDAGPLPDPVSVACD